MTELSLDATRSTVRVQTFAEGILARLAHDIELVFGSLTGSASRDEKRCAIEAPLAGVRVAGVLAGSRIDETTLSPSDRHDILEKMRRDVFRASLSDRVTITATLESSTAKVTLTPPKGRPLSITMTPAIADEDGGVRITGSFDVSITAIGGGVVKGPMNAFRVKDRVVVKIDLLFVPQPA